MSSPHQSDDGPDHTVSLGKNPPPPPPGAYPPPQQQQQGYGQSPYARPGYEQYGQQQPYDPNAYAQQQPYPTAPDAPHHPHADYPTQPPGSGNTHSTARWHE